MTSRLDRLFILLESGSSAVTRRAAARQIGEVQKLHPHELHNLLNRLQTYLQNSSWDTRIAAGQTLEAILSNVPKWEPVPSLLAVKKEAAADADQSSEDAAAATEKMSVFSNFELDRVLLNGARLTGSEGTEFDLGVEDNGCNAAGVKLNAEESLRKQHALLNQRFDLANGGLNTEQIITLEDMKVEPQQQREANNAQHMIPVQDMFRSVAGSSTAAENAGGLSCREMNRARRKARHNPALPSSQFAAAVCSSMSSKISINGSADDPLPKKIKLESGGTKSVSGLESSGGDTLVTNNNNNISGPVPDATGTWTDALDWPLQGFCLKLYADMFSPRWESRHGAAIGLRELFRAHLDGAGKRAVMTRSEMEEAHQKFLENAILRLLSVLALDRFGDFISDQVIAPVRETCAQVLGIISKRMAVDKVLVMTEVVLKLVTHRDWEVRHGGLLAIKYLLVVREDLLTAVIPVVIKPILLGLFDPVDDVSSVAASTLIPIAVWLPKLLSAVEVSNMVKMLWDLLLEQDELTAACNSFMGLLAAILGLPRASDWIQMEPMAELVPRLWPFLCHSTSSVRKSTLQTLITLTRPTTTIATTTTKPDNVVQADTKAMTPGLAILNKPANLNLQFGVKEWPSQLLQDTMRHIYQRVLVEHLEDVQRLAEDVWNNLIENANLSALLNAACPYVATWLCLAMQPTRMAFDRAHWIQAKESGSERKRSSVSSDLLGVGQDTVQEVQGSQKYFLGGTETIPADVREQNVMRARIKACQMLGTLSKFLVLPAPGVVYTEEMGSPILCYAKVLNGYLTSRSSLQRLISGLVIAFWAKHDATIGPEPPLIRASLIACLAGGESFFYDEMTAMLARLLQEGRDFMATLKQYNVPLPNFEESGGSSSAAHPNILSLEQIVQLATTVSENARKRFALRQKAGALVEERRKGLYNSYVTVQTEQQAYHTYTQAALAGALVQMRSLPDKLNPVIKPLMEAVKREPNELLQRLSAEFLVELLDQVQQLRQSSPNAKIVTNVALLLKSDPEFTPKIVWPERRPCEYRADEVGGPNNPVHGILTLHNQQKVPVRVTATMSNGSVTPAPRGPGRPPAHPPVENVVTEEQQQEQLAAEDPQRKWNKTQRRGAILVLQQICRHFGDALPESVPRLWELLHSPVLMERMNGARIEAMWEGVSETLVESETSELVTVLQLIEVCVPCLATALEDRFFVLLPQLCHLLKHPLNVIRHMASRCIATFAKVNPVRVMDVVIRDVLPLLEDNAHIAYRQGAAEAIACIVERLQFSIVPYVVLLIVPTLGRMSDFDQCVRLMATHCFATLIQLMPLDGSTPAPDMAVLTDQLRARKERDKLFVEQLFCPKTIPKVSVPKDLVRAELRSYQQAGVNWLGFLNRYKLHGILCDDMGLGKTLQAICILASDHRERRTNGEPEWPSLVVCPPTLTGHWVYEVGKFVPDASLRPLQYAGLPADRERLRDQVASANLVIASYDIVRKDIEFFRRINWNYCVLDEGHIIKNGKTKSAKAIKLLVANHRLILSGTPIQNNVLELWSLFDFLMPGFLGTERQFVTRFSRPILASRDAKSSTKEQEAGALAMETLHRQVLPFLLRRIKEDVLMDLPPKIIQDLLCELSPLQEKLYEDFSKTHFKKDLQECFHSIRSATNGQQQRNETVPAENGSAQLAQRVPKANNVFQALRYLQNVCNHPKLVLNANHPEYEQIRDELHATNTTLDSIEHSAKLPALKQLLLDCGIGLEDVSVNQHRALIFCQLKAMLDIVERDLLRKHLPAVSYLRLDGSVPAGQRHEIVTKFNSDPSIDVLLLTTQVGGLGLNLTGADTVIFVEHDWNPMKDLQAMDRAHRIGQKKVVNVYRLITRKSLEEKIMCLQKFKLLTANTVVSDENASMDTMGTDQMLDLFNLTDNDTKKRGGNGDATAGVGAGSVGEKPATMKTILETLPELWEDCQYQEEYDLTQFIRGLKNG